MHNLIIATLLALITFNTYAISPEKIGYCKAYSELAEVIMTARQDGVPMEDLLMAINKASVDTGSTYLVTSAYRQHRYSSTLDKQIAIDEFTVGIMAQCVNIQSQYR